MKKIKILTLIIGIIGIILIANTFSIYQSFNEQSSRCDKYNNEDFNSSDSLDNELYNSKLEKQLSCIERKFELASNFAFLGLISLVFVFLTILSWRIDILKMKG